MSDKPSEYLKRTCLICGCHTNQTINIYEPRSGPNIVQLIQAKFKFQPLNEDKYLCFSCNNWLINWHSLQALNSNDAESPSGTFRNHMNGMNAQEKGAEAQERPVAQVRPRQLEADLVTDAPAAEQISAAMRAAPSYTIRHFSKRSFHSNHRLRRFSPHKFLQTCYVCGRAIVVRMRATLGAAKVLQKSKTQLAKCRKCREVCRWRRFYMHSLVKAQLAGQKAMSKKKPAKIPPHPLVHAHTQRTNQNHAAHNQSQSTRKQSLQRPLVDGKVVAMLRRLGTTLSREHSENDTHGSKATRSTALPPIMSPAKPKPRWTRHLEDDEILLDFNTAISEVFPIPAEQDTAAHSSGQEVAPKQTRRKLTYQMTKQANDEACMSADVIELSEDEDTLSGVGKAPRPPQSIYNLIPSGLSVSLI